jgi:hypothetical protein
MPIESNKQKVCHYRSEFLVVIAHLHLALLVCLFPSVFLTRVVKALCTSRKVEGSRLEEVNEFNLPNPSGRSRPWGLLSL